LIPAEVFREALEIAEGQKLKEQKSKSWITALVIVAIWLSFGLILIKYWIK